MEKRIKPSTLELFECHGAGIAKLHRTASRDVSLNEAAMVNDNQDLVEEFVAASRVALHHHLADYGVAIYSSKTTLRRNPVVFWGYNSAYAPAVDHPVRWTIENSLQQFADGFRCIKIQSDADVNRLQQAE